MEDEISISDLFKVIEKIGIIKDDVKDEDFLDERNLKQRV